MNGGERVARVLDNAGITTVFGLTGGHISPVIEACDDRGIDVITTRHEQSAGFMAAAWGVITRAPGVCLVTAGPGFTNAYSAFTQAHESHQPMVSLSGQYELMAKGQGALQEIDQIAMAEEVSKYAESADSVQRLVTYTQQALRQAVTPPRGHAHVSLPIDILYLVHSDEDDSEPSFTPRDKYIHHPDRPSDEEAITEATKALHQARQPVVIAGGGVWYQEAQKELEEFVERTKIPTFTHEEARGMIPDSHEYCFGSPLYKLNGASRQIKDADCVLLLDARLDWRLDYGEPPMLPDSDIATIIHATEIGDELGEKIPVDIGIVGDAKSLLRQLTDAAANFEWAPQNDWHTTLKEANVEFEAKFDDDRASNDIPINPARLCDELESVLGSSGRIIFDGGNIGKWGKMMLSAERPGRWLRFKGPFGCLGYGLPTAIAVQHYAPNDDVILLTGDGAYGYNAMELETAVRYDLPVTVVVANNGAWGSVGGRSAPTGTELPHTSFHELARDVGAEGELVTDPEELQDALQRGVESDSPYCLNVETQNVRAPVDYPKTLKGY